jgi:hypothetical protein
MVSVQVGRDRNVEKLVGAFESRPHQNVYC